MPDIVDFTLMGIQYLYILIATLELYPGVQLSYFKTAWLLLRLIRQNQSLVLLGLVSPHYEGKILLRTQTDVVRI